MWCNTLQDRLTRLTHPNFIVVQCIRIATLNRMGMAPPHTRHATSTCARVRACWRRTHTLRRTAALHIVLCKKACGRLHARRVCSFAAYRPMLFRALQSARGAAMDAFTMRLPEPDLILFEVAINSTLHGAFENGDLDCHPSTTR